MAMQQAVVSEFGGFVAKNRQSFAGGRGKTDPFKGPQLLLGDYFFQALGFGLAKIGKGPAAYWAITIDIAFIAQEVDGATSQQSASGAMRDIFGQRGKIMCVMKASEKQTLEESIDRMWYTIQQIRLKNETTGVYEPIETSQIALTQQEKDTALDSEGNPKYGCTLVELLQYLDNTRFFGIVTITEGKGGRLNINLKDTVTPESVDERCGTDFANGSTMDGTAKVGETITDETDIAAEQVPEEPVYEEQPEEPAYEGEQPEEPVYEGDQAAEPAEGGDEQYEEYVDEPEVAPPPAPLPRKAATPRPAPAPAPAPKAPPAPAPARKAAAPRPTPAPAQAAKPATPAATKTVPRPPVPPKR